MDGSTLNKIFGAVLGCLLIGFVIIEVSHALYPNPRQSVHLDQMGYPVEVAHGDDHGGGEEVVEEGPDLATLLAEASADAGEGAVRACVSCHSFEEGGPNRVGPNLWDIVGRPVAAVEGFGYSNAMGAYGGTWTFERLFAFLERPRAEVPGTSMSYAGMRRDSQRADVIMYLRSLSDDPVPLPTPAPAEEAMDNAAAAGEDMVEGAEEAIEGADAEAGDAAEGAEAIADDMSDEASEAAGDAGGDAGDMTEEAMDDDSEGAGESE